MRSISEDAPPFDCPILDSPMRFARLAALCFACLFSLAAHAQNAHAQNASAQVANAQSASAETAVAQGISLGQRKAIAAANQAVAIAGKQFAAEDYQAAGKSIRVAIEQVAAADVANSAEAHQSLLPAMQRISKAHTLLQFEGVTLPPFQVPPAPETKPMPTPTPKSKPLEKTPPEKPAVAPENGVSFINAVAPILANRCGGCHINGSKGGFSLATFASLMKGPPEGVVIFAGDTVGSRLIEIIETGDMPRGGGKVSPAELNTLKQWILTGAKFDGPDPNASISTGTSTTTPAPTMAAPTVKRRTGTETVSFAKDIAPILVNHCNGCHVDAMQTRGGLNMNTFAQLFRGGDSGAVVQPGRGDASLIVKKIRGIEGDRMPSGGRPALSEKDIQLITTWIDEGATLDGGTDNQPLRVMSQLAWASSASPEDVTARRRELADDHMKLVNATGAPVNEKITSHFRVVGTASSATVDLVAKLAEEQMKLVATVVKAPQGESFYNGRATLFVLPRRYDYSEFAKMVESRSLPSEWTGHWQFDGIDAYVAIVATDRDDEETITARLISPMTALAVSTRGDDVPRWLAEGVGASTAARKRGADRDQRQKMQAEISQAVAAMDDAKKFIDGKMTPEQSDRVGAAIATRLMDRTNRRNFDRCLQLLEDGKTFEAAFTETFGVSPAAFIEAWLTWVRG